MRAGALILGVPLALCTLVTAVPGQGQAQYDHCYREVGRMGFTSVDMKQRSWADCLSQFRRPSVPAASSGLSENERLLLLQYLLQRQLQLEDEQRQQAQRVPVNPVPVTPTLPPPPPGISCSSYQSGNSWYTNCR